MRIEDKMGVYCNVRVNYIQGNHNALKVSKQHYLCNDL
jgi:hypothetical protein